MSAEQHQDSPELKLSSVNKRWRWFCKGCCNVNVLTCARTGEYSFCCWLQLINESKFKIRLWLSHSDAESNELSTDVLLPAVFYASDVWLLNHFTKKRLANFDGFCALICMAQSDVI